MPYAPASSVTRPIFDRPRDSASKRGYGRRWGKASKLFLDAYPACGQRPNGQVPVMSRCYELGYITAAQQVDHIVPHRGDQALFWDSYSNWQSLCASCGSRKSRAGL